MRRSVIWAKNRSTWLSHDALVGVKCGTNSGCRTNHSPHPRVLVRPVVVHHHVDRRPRLARQGRVDVVEERQELLVPVPPVAPADHLPRRHVQGREQGRGAVPDVVVAGLLGPPRQQRLGRLGAVEGLDLALLVHAQDDGPLRRGQVQPDDVPDLLDEERVGRELERLAQVRLEAERPPDPDDGRLGQAEVAGQRAGTPVGRVRRAWTSRVRVTAASTCASVIVRGAPGRGSSASPSSRRGGEPVPPLADGRAG